MSKFKIGDRVCSSRDKWLSIKMPGTVIEVTGAGSEKRYVVQLDTPMFPDSPNPRSTTTLPAKHFVLISTVEATLADRARTYAEYQARQSAAL